MKGRVYYYRVPEMNGVRTRDGYIALEYVAGLHVF